MGASENEGIDLLSQEGLEVAFQHGVRHGILEQSLLNERNQQWAGFGNDPCVRIEATDRLAVGVACNRRTRSDDADASAPRGMDCGGGAGFEDPDHRDGGCWGQLRNGKGRCGVAGHDQQSGTLGQQELGNLPAVAGHGLGAFPAVGNAGGVSEIEDLFGGKGPAEGGHDGESSDA